MSAENIQFFRFKTPEQDNSYDIWEIPVTVTENSDTLNFSSSWSTVNVQGSTEAMSAYNYTNNPTMPVQLKFHEDLWRDYRTKFENYHTYRETINKLVSLQYPGGKSTIKPPYVYIAFNEYVFRGYFTSLRIVQSGPLRADTDGILYRPICDVSGQFIIVKKSSPTREGIQSSLNRYFV